jgi:hypothetical protein
VPLELINTRYSLLLVNKSIGTKSLCKFFQNTPITSYLRFLACLFADLAPLLSPFNWTILPLGEYSKRVVKIFGDCWLLHKDFTGSIMAAKSATSRARIFTKVEMVRPIVDTWRGSFVK